MTCNSRLVVTVLFGTVSLCAPAGSRAQQQATTQAPAAQPTTSTAVASPAVRPSLKFGADYELASWLAADAHVALAGAQLAEEKAATDEVRTLARQDAARQAYIINALRPFLGDEALVMPAPPEEAARQTTATTTNTAPANAVQPAAADDANSTAPTPPVVSTAVGPAFTLVSLKRSLADQAASTLLGELSKASGEEFDRKYRDYLAVANLRSEATLRTFREHASPALRTVVDALLAPTAAESPNSTAQAPSGR
ncbi:MAG: hypothetical protein QM775_07830 [Pirellulales bacterium]